MCRRIAVHRSTARSSGCRGRVGFLVVQTTAGAQVLVDDVQVGYAPLPDPVPVDAGQHRVDRLARGPRSGQPRVRRRRPAERDRRARDRVPVTTPPPSADKPTRRRRNAHRRPGRRARHRTTSRGGSPARSWSTSGVFAFVAHARRAGPHERCATPIPSRRRSSTRAQQGDRARRRDHRRADRRRGRLGRHRALPHASSAASADVGQEDASRSTCHRPAWLSLGRF